MTVALMFPGQGSQFPGMVEAWLDHPASAAVVREASQVLDADLVSLTADADALRRTDVVQPAVMTCDVAAFRVLESEGLRPAAVCGHSLGEYAALVAADVVDFGAALQLVRDRALAMDRACQEAPGAMSAVIAGPEEAAALCAEAADGDVLVVANENSPQQTVISGSVAAIGRAEELAARRGLSAIRVRVAGAFHSPLMASALGPIAAAVARVQFRPPRFPVVPNLTGEPTTDPDLLEDLLCRHVTSPVRWVSTMTSLAGLGAEAYVEAGPGDVLTRLTRRCLPGATVFPAGTPDEALAAVAADTQEDPHD